MKAATDYETYREIMGELLRPIDVEGLDFDTVKRLYESKLVYLHNLRLKCFMEMNSPSPHFFKVSDYELILKAQKQTQRQLQELVRSTIEYRLRRRQLG